jgi:hypothetical protein
VIGEIKAQRGDRNQTPLDGPAVGAPLLGLLHRDGKLVRHPPGERTFDISIAPAAISYFRA